MKKLIIAAIALSLIALPAVGFAVTQDSEPAQECNQYLEQAAAEMGLTIEQAKNTLEQARELRLRMMGHRKGLTYEQTQEKLEQHRNQKENRINRRELRRGKGLCNPDD